jgi:restriction endonuclease S subunit
MIRPPFIFPTDWKPDVLSAVADIVPGKTPAKAEYRSSGDIKVIKFRDVSEAGGVDFTKDDEGWMDSTQIGRTEFAMLLPETILLTNAAHSLSHIGKKIGYVEALPHSTPTCFVGELTSLRAKSADVNTRWLFYLLQTEPLRREIAKAAEGAHLVPYWLKRVPLAQPTEQEQNRIADTLKAADEHIRVLENQIGRAERLKRALMQSVFPYERDTAGLPTIDDFIVAPVTNGYSPVCPDYETGRWVLGLDALTAHGFDPEGRKPAPTDDPKLLGNELQDDDILISRSNTRERVGFSGRYEGNPTPCFYPDLMMCVRVDHARIKPQYLDLLLQSEFARRYFQARAGGTSGSMVKIKERDVRQMPVILPCIDEQDVVVERFKASAMLIKALRRKLSAARCVKQSLLQSLLTGKIRLSD